MITYRAALAIGIGFLFAPSCSAEEPKLADTTEKLTAAEEKAVREALKKPSAVTATHPDALGQRRLVVLNDIQSAYDAKPQATVRLLLAVVKDGDASQSIRAAAYIDALVKSPVTGALTVRAPQADWDEPEYGGTKSPREIHYQICVERIFEKENPKMKPPVPPGSTDPR